MTDNTPTKEDVTKATSEDLAFILQWLEREYREDDGNGFWCNRRIISCSLDEDALWVIRRNGEAVAIQVGDYSADIVSVRKDHRNSGLGKALFDASLERAWLDNVNVLRVECKPESSFGFWKRMGFAQYGSCGQFDDIFVRHVIERRFDLPPERPKANVVISYYPEHALYGDDSSIPPICRFSLVGAHLDDGSTMLERRALGINDEVPCCKDLVIKIEIDGDLRCFCKAKHEPARNAGVIHDIYGGAFYIDKIKPTSGDN